jgi:hypothetical protein
MECSVYGENVHYGLLNCITDGFLRGYLRRFIIPFAQLLLARFLAFSNPHVPLPSHSAQPDREGLQS